MSTLANVIKKIDAEKAVKIGIISYFPTQDLYFMEVFFELKRVISQPAGETEPSSLLYIVKQIFFSSK